MQLRYKILIALGVILTMGMLSFVIYKQLEISRRQTAIETSVVAQKTLVDGIVRSSNEYATKKDIDGFIKDHNINLKAIQDDMKKLHAEVAAVNVVTVVSNPQVVNHIPVTNTGPTNPNPNPVPVCPDGTVCPNVDPYGYLKSQQNLAIDENFGDKKVPIGSVGFSAWQKDPWNIDLKGREYSVSSVVGTDENQRTYIYNKFTVKVDGKSYDVPISKAETKQEYPEAKFSWWNPRLFMGISAGVNINPTLAANITPNLNIGIMSYGMYRNNPDFSILEVGAGYDTISKSYQLSLTPFTYNVGKHIPLTKNIYVGPSLQIGTNGGFSITGTIQVGL